MRNGDRAVEAENIVSTAIFLTQMFWHPPSCCFFLFSRHVRRSLADALAPELRAVYDSMAPTGPYKKNAEEVRTTTGGMVAHHSQSAAASSCLSLVHR